MLVLYIMQAKNVIRYIRLLGDKTHVNADIL